VALVLFVPRYVLVCCSLFLTERAEPWQALADKTTAFFSALPADGVLRLNSNRFVSLPRHPTMETQSSPRFNETFDEGSGKYMILHRDLANRIVAEAGQRATSPGQDNNNRLYVHGAQGVGNSHSTYEAVCTLMAKRDLWRVVYMNDCKAWADAQDTVTHLKEHIAMAFHPEDDRPIWDACVAARTAKDVLTLLFTTIPSYCTSRSLKFAFVFDQHNGLTQGQRAVFPFSLLERQMCNDKSWKGTGALVISASANNEYQLEVLGKETFKRIDVFKGFSDGERDLWSAQNDLFVGDDDWESVTGLYNNLPLALGTIKSEYVKRTAAGQTTTLLDLLDYCEGSMKGKMTQREMEWFLDILQRPDRDRSKQAYYRMILDMLLGAGGKIVEQDYHLSMQFMNRHLMYWDDDSKMFRPIHELARQIFVSLRYVSLQTVLDDKTVVDILGASSASVNRSVKGSMVELYTIACAEDVERNKGQLYFSITSVKSKGKDRHDIVLRPETFREFATQSVPAGLDFSRPAVFKPKNSNYPGIDLLILVIHEETRKKKTTVTKELFAVQFTVGPIKDHALPSDDLLAKWEAASGATLYYVWATPPEAVQVTADHAGHFHCSLTDLKFADLLRFYRH